MLEYLGTHHIIWSNISNFKTSILKSFKKSDITEHTMCLHFCRVQGQGKHIYALEVKLVATLTGDARRKEGTSGELLTSYFSTCMLVTRVFSL